MGRVNDATRAKDVLHFGTAGVSATLYALLEPCAECGARPYVAPILGAPLKWAECRIGHHIYFQL
jgi:hypothetical protein